jgi:ABC-2 type transport system permease protein
MSRLWGLARAELILLLRNRMQLLVALLMPIAVPFLYLPLARMDLGPAHLANSMGLMLVIALLFVVYYNLMCAYVARRQELVLKRLRTGEASDATVLTAAAVPALVIALVMCAIMFAISMPLLDLPAPSHAVLIILGILLGAAVMVPLALATCNMTRTVESAQVTCLPFMAIAIIGSGAAIPLEMMPDWFRRISDLTPTAPIVSLIRLGWQGIDAGGTPVTGTDVWTTAAVQVLILVAWFVLATSFVTRRFRWEPRA